MYQYQDQKEMRRALNSKMIIMLVGIMLVVTALTSTCLTVCAAGQWRVWQTAATKIFWRH